MHKNHIEEQALQFQACALPISFEFHQAISQQMRTADLLASRSITLNFRDTSYSSEAGGFHPVEIAVHKVSKDKWCISYITDFAYFGLGYPELERDIDFDIANNMAFATGIGWQSIGSSGFIELYLTWESNFLAYLSIDAFDEIKVSVN